MDSYTEIKKKNNETSFSLFEMKTNYQESVTN